MFLQESLSTSEISKNASTLKLPQKNGTSAK